MKKRTIEEIDVKSKKVLLRVDYNVPMDSEGNIIDDTKIEKSLETVKYLNDEKAKLIIVSHLGRPNGKFEEKLSLKPICNNLSYKLGKSITFAESLTGEDTDEIIEEMLPGDIVMLENSRFDPSEEKNTSSLSKKLASYADVFVNDAFGCSHRKHSSVVGVSKYVDTYAGFLLSNEIETLAGIFERIERPLSIVLGGSKIESKVNVIKNYVNKVDNIILGGEFVSLIFSAMGYDVDDSKLDKEKVKMVKEVVKIISEHSEKIHLPIDVLVSDEVEADAETAHIPIKFIHPKLKILDIGPKTITKYCNIMEKSTTIVWDGPLGHINFLDGTNQVAEVISGIYGNSVIGGMETLNALSKLDFSLSRFTHVSTGGAAMLEFMQHGTLPGIENIPKVWGV